MPKIIMSLVDIPIRRDSFDKITEGWRPIGNHKEVDGFVNMTSIPIAGKTITVGCPHYNPETYALCFLVQYRQAWHPFKSFSDPKNKQALENVNAVLSLSDNCDVSLRYYKMKTVLVAEMSSLNVLKALLKEAGEPLMKNMRQQTDEIEDVVEACQIVQRP